MCISSIYVSCTHFVHIPLLNEVQSNQLFSFAPAFNINKNLAIVTKFQNIFLLKCCFQIHEIRWKLFKSWIWPWHSHKQPKYGLNQWHVARNRLSTPKTFRNDVSHITFEQTVQKLYKQDICGGHLGFSLLVHFLQNICKVVHPGCVRAYM